jgi:hypothetical protein
MDNVRLRIQVDFGVGDVMVPGPRMIEYPALLDSDTIQLLAYPSETAIAEKLEAHGVTRKCQQPDERFLRRVDLLAAPQSRHRHAPESHWRYVREPRNAPTRGRFRGTFAKLC